VRSFNGSLEHFDDYSNFMALYDVDASPTRLQHVAHINGIEFYLGWVVGNPHYLDC
jgi:hypothetical protein